MIYSLHQCFTRTIHNVDHVAHQRRENSYESSHQRFLGELVEINKLVYV